MAAKTPTKPKPSDLLTTGQFAKLVYRTPVTVRRWIDSGVIPPEAVEEINGRYHVRRWAKDEVWS